jgi:hypothetical protein
MDINPIIQKQKKRGNGLNDGFINFYSGVPTEKRTKRGVSINLKKKFSRNVID